MERREPDTLSRGVLEVPHHRPTEGLMPGGKITWKELESEGEGKHERRSDGD
jgi:hypothetical protein